MSTSHDKLWNQAEILFQQGTEGQYDECATRLGIIAYYYACYHKCRKWLQSQGQVYGKEITLEAHRTTWNELSTFFGSRGPEVADLGYVECHGWRIEANYKMDLTLSLQNAKTAKEGMVLLDKLLELLPDRFSSNLELRQAEAEKILLEVLG